MQPLVFLLMVLALGATMSNQSSNSYSEWNNRGDTLAQQMSWYHNLAVAQCDQNAGFCPPGVITLTPENQAKLGGGTVGYGTQFQAVTDGATMVVTMFSLNRAERDNDPAWMYGPINSHLRTQSGDSAMAGPWSLAAQAINPGTNYNGYSQGVPLPQGFGGLTLPDSVPVIATIIN